MTATVNLSPLPKQRFTDSNGNPLVGGKVFTYAAGTVTKQNSYTDSTGTTPNQNPVLLDARGEASIWLDQSLSYKVVLSPSTDSDPPTAPIWTQDNIPAGNSSFLNFLVTLALSTGASLIGWIQAGTGSVLRSIQDKLRDTVNAKDFGVTANGVTDDTTALAAFSTYIGINRYNGQLPPGTIVCSAFNVPAGVTVRGHGSGGYTPLTGLGTGGTIIQSTATGTAVSLAQSAYLKECQVRPAGYAALTTGNNYALGNYPQGTGNTAFGIAMAQSARCYDVVAFGFSAGGFVPQGATTRVIECYGIQCANGLLNGGVASASSCTITNGVMTIGGTVTGAFAAGQTINFIPAANSATGCTIAAGVLTVPGAPTGDAYSIGMQLTGANIPAGLSIASFGGTGTGGAGTYPLALASGGTIPTISTGQVIYAIGDCAGVTISTMGTSTGGAGTVNLSNTTLTASGARTISGMVAATDGWITDSVFMFNSGASGCDVSTANFVRLIDNRIEWNARYPAIVGAETTGAGNILDRNGWGIRFLDGDWGQAWGVNYASRNGCGGDPVQGVGRWGFSTPSDPSWVPTPPIMSTQIIFGFQRRIALVGWVFRPGQSDANDGARSPAYVFQFDGASGSTPITDIQIRGCSGIQLDTTPGFNAAAYGGIGAIATGSDTFLVSCFVNGFELGPQVLQSNIFMSQPVAFTSSTTRAFQVPKGSCGYVEVSAQTSSACGVAWIPYMQDLQGNNKSAPIPTGVAAPVGTLFTGASASLTTGTAPFDTFTITLTGAASITGTVHASK